MLQHASLQAEKQFYEEKTEQTDVQFAEGRDWQAVPAVEPPVEKSKDDMWIDKTSSKKDQRMSQNVDAVIDPIPSSSSHADRVKQGGGGKSFEI